MSKSKRAEPRELTPPVDWAGIATSRVNYDSAATIFGQGDPAPTAMESCTVLTVEKPEMVRQLRAKPGFAERFLSHRLTRNIRIEEDLGSIC